MHAVSRGYATLAVYSRRVSESCGYLVMRDDIAGAMRKLVLHQLAILLGERHLVRVVLRHKAAGAHLHTLQHRIVSTRTAWCAQRRLAQTTTRCIFWSMVQGEAERWSLREATVAPPCQRRAGPCAHWMAAGTAAPRPRSCRSRTARMAARMYRTRCAPLRRSDRFSLSSAQSSWSRYELSCLRTKRRHRPSMDLVPPRRATPAKRAVAKHP
jgi:hypothetical protein